MRIADTAGQPCTDLLHALDSGKEGLSDAEAAVRRARYGDNRITFHHPTPVWRLLAAEFFALFPLLLLAAALLALLADHLSPHDGYDLIGLALFGVVVLNALVSFVQTYKAERLTLAFLAYIPQSVVVLRGGDKVLKNTWEVAPGDVVFVQEGDKIPADGVMLAGGPLVVDESILTGESHPRHKRPSETIDPDATLFCGALVHKGEGRMLVVATGAHTTLGEISRTTTNLDRTETPMQKELKGFVRVITWLALGIGALFFVIGMALGNPFWGNLIFAIGIIVANVPEGLLPTVTLALTQASLRMRSHNAVVKRLVAVETLGSTTVICTDKTGTLTQNRLHVAYTYLDGMQIEAAAFSALLQHPAGATAAEIMALCHDAIATRDVDGSVRFHGDPTEVALAQFVDTLPGFAAVTERFVSLSRRAFDAEARYMAATYHTQGDTLYQTVKGAPEVVLGRSHYLHRGGHPTPMNEADRSAISAQAKRYAADGLRVLALAYRIADAPGGEPEGLVFVGLVALVDPPRPEVPAAVAACQTAGIRIVVMSGDKAETVAYIARTLGIAQAPRIIEGPELATMADAALHSALSGEVLFARIAPEQKLRVVEALQAMGEVVAVTGDGVNDAPALKRADIGVAMGLKGTDVAKEASDIILLDDNFATIVAAIEQGRAVYDNIRKFITYILTSNIPEILPFLAFVLFPIPPAMTVVQILAIDLITDVLPAIGLGNEPPEADTMRRPPRPRDEHLVGMSTFVRSYLIAGPVEALLAFAAFFTVLSAGGWRWGEELLPDTPLYAQATAAFLTAIIFGQIGNVQACRTARLSALPLLRRFNPWIAGGIAFELLFVAAILTIPTLQPLFTVAPFPAQAWVWIIAAPLLLFAVTEIRKGWLRRPSS
ncbi:MAG: ATPase [Alphaproteobacteria bacterium CG_4_10_14_0_2_um_filter_63_37]|nr:MAG: ATPase [Proteobacteria bacterium CG1_02_64_396]PJA25301.1 MAG: ATPase [Alphaproteobacteria bacterium CG_4_10_14_0_2_um_filter_63_37]